MFSRFVFLHFSPLSASFEFRWEAIVNMFLSYFYAFQPVWWLRDAMRLRVFTR